MKLKYEFVNGDINEIEVDEYWGNLIHSISTIEPSCANPSDVANEPHILTHSIDAIRYLIVSVNLDKEEFYIINNPVLW